MSVHVCEQVKQMCVCESVCLCLLMCACGDVLYECVFLCVFVCMNMTMCLEKFPEGNTPEFQEIIWDGGIAAVLVSSYAFLYFQVFHNKNALLLQLDKNEKVNGHAQCTSTVVCPH